VQMWSGGINGQVWGKRGGCTVESRALDSANMVILYGKQTQLSLTARVHKVDYCNTIKTKTNQILRFTYVFEDVLVITLV
jgi:hypothetical protein